MKQRVALRIVLMVTLGIVLVAGISLPAPISGGIAEAQAPCAPPLPPQIRAQNDGPDVLWVTVTAMTPVRALRFRAAQNALLDVPGGPVSSTGNFDLDAIPTPTQVRFIVRRNGGQMYVPFGVVDACGEWPSAVGDFPTGTPTLTPTPIGQPTVTPTARSFDPRNYIGQGDRYNCIDFDSQAHAQAVLRADPSDPNRLDTSDPTRGQGVPDGIACNTMWEAPEWSAAFFFPEPLDLTPVAGRGSTLPPTVTPTATRQPFDPRSYVGQGDRYNCVDFASQANAQAVLRVDPSDPNRLDTSSPQWPNVPDGVACSNGYEAPEWAAAFFYPEPLDSTPVATRVAPTPTMTR